jgi:hypothetical protein
VCVVYAGLSASDRVALSNVVRNISGAFDAAFSCWSVGVGIEDQLNLLRNSVGLSNLPSLATRKSGLYLGPVCTCVCLSVCVCVYVCVCVCACICECMYVCTYIRVRVCVCVCVCIFKAWHGKVTCRWSTGLSDYKRMVRPEVILATYESETYRHSEDFFFRSIHLVTECWAFVALRSLNSASQHTLLGEYILTTQY